MDLVVLYIFLLNWSLCILLAFWGNSLLFIYFWWTEIFIKPHLGWPKQNKGGCCQNQTNQKDYMRRTILPKSEHNLGTPINRDIWGKSWEKLSTDRPDSPKRSSSPLRKKIRTGLGIWLNKNDLKIQVWC